MEWEYRSIYKEHIRIAGKQYASAEDILNAEGADGWELVSVVAINGIYETIVYEVFYLKRKKTGSSVALPAV